jgi:hypothetical protein
MAGTRILLGPALPARMLAMTMEGVVRSARHSQVVREGI